MYLRVVTPKTMPKRSKTTHLEGPVNPGPQLQPPDHWEEVYANILEMRKNKDAPVDTMGCERAHDDSALPQVHIGLYNCRPTSTVCRDHRFHICCLSVRARTSARPHKTKQILS